ncbi:hypothetical protein ACFQVD_41130 [Streptosporangium amethystogenes subsp. fukuiense]|uniref:Gram-positive cocci surface proteins LPxTG domain-containing protein n=1 Tax=Streptosporangium amethystogenes subsp. fukuiense TaxID=698418 RepID=A0ABW2TE59_9ACTN
MGVALRVRSVLSVTVLAVGLVLLLQPVGAAVTEVRQDSGVLTGIVEYQCTTTGSAEKQDIKVEVALTMPTTATTGEQMSIGWQGTYAEGTGLKAPATGLTTGTGLYAYASISELPGLTSATGVGTLTTVAANQVIPLPTVSVSLKTTPSNAGTATVRPAALNFGTAANAPSIECEVQNRTALTTYPLTVTAADQTGTEPETDTGTETDTDTESDAGTEPETDTGTDGNGKVQQTPSGPAATGGGGERGPDGRVFLLTGSLLILTAATGLLLRRRAWR